MGLQRLLPKKNGGGFLTEHFPEARKTIWDFQGMLHDIAPCARACPWRASSIPA